MIDGIGRSRTNGFAFYLYIVVDELLVCNPNIANQSDVGLDSLYTQCTVGLA